MAAAAEKDCGETGGIFNENGIGLSLKLKGHRTPPVEIVDKPLCLHAKMRGRKADRQLHARMRLPLYCPIASISCAMAKSVRMKKRSSSVLSLR